MVSSMRSVEIRLNGEVRHVPATLTLSGLLEHLSVNPERVAVEFNREIVKRSDWSSTEVHQGAEVEIVEFVGGGR